MMRVNLSVAIVAMTTPQSLKNQSIEACPSNSNDSNNTPAKVDKQNKTKQMTFEILCLFIL